MKKKVISDMMLNIIAAALPIAMLQLIIYPKVAAASGGDEYGLMITIYSIWIMVSNSLGNVLNNVKLLRFTEYQRLGLEGDVPVLLRRWLGASSFFVFIVIWTYCGEFSVRHLIPGVIISCLIALKAYLEVGFRIKLNYKAIVINNALLSIGFAVGYLLYTKTMIWELIFLLGYLFSCIYCIKKTGLLREPCICTDLFNEIRKDSYSLLAAAVISNLINYADKLVLYPLMGGTAVSVYYTATILAKITSMLTGPINSVILSYITRWDNTKSRVFNRVLFFGIILAVCGYFATLFLARPVIGYLFPQWVDEVMDIIPITTIAIMLTVLASLLQPFVMRYCNLHWQIVINGIGSLTYFACALILWRNLGLRGFCIGTVVGAGIKVLTMIAVYQSKAPNGIEEDESIKQSL